MEQPIPNISSADVERVIKRDFGENRFHEVLVLLQQYGAEDYEKEAVRVRLAILKLSGPDFNKLEANIKTAKADYRDVLLFAEYPLCAEFPNTLEMTPSMQDEVFSKDWQQYQEWLYR